MARLVAFSALRNRRVAREELEKAKLAGSKRDIRTWESNLKKVEKQIADYQLDRYDRPGLYSDPDQSGNSTMDNPGPKDACLSYRSKSGSS